MPERIKRYKPQRSNWQSDKQRGTRTQRGYDNVWLRRRAAKLNRNPMCEVCRSRAAAEVHHIIPFKRRDDVLRLQWDNLMSVCAACHRRLTRARRATGP